MDYIILKDSSEIELSKEVMEYLERGWVLQGGVSCSLSENDEYRYTIFAQALVKSQEKLLKAVEPFVSEAMERHLSNWPDDTLVRLEVPDRNGYSLMVTLKDMRGLWKAYRAARQ